MGKECDGPILPRSQWTAEAGCWSPCVIPGMFVVGLMSLLVALVPLLIGDPEPCQGVDTQRYGDSAGIVLFVFGLVFYLVFSSLSLYSWISCAFTDPGCPPEFTLSASSSSLSASSLSASASPSSPASTSPSHSRKQQKKNKNNRAADNDDDDDDDDDEEKGRAQLGSPLTPTVDENSNSQNSQNSQNSNDGSKRSKQCPRCHLLKGPRTHHCSTCRRCVVRYDHHCPWVNNCVGVRNHKFFFLFTFWGCINSLFVIMVLLLRYALVGWSFCLVDLGVLPAIILACFGGLFTGSMCVSHANLIARNMTTVEYTAAMEARYGARRPLARRGRPLPPPQPVDYYDLGCTANCAAIMGPSCLLCLCPVANQSASFDFPHPKYDEV